MSSAIIQLYLRLILDSYFHADLSLRTSVLDLLIVILHRGLVNPIVVRPPIQILIFLQSMRHCFRVTGNSVD